MNEGFLSEAIHHGFLFRKLALGGEHCRTQPDNVRQTDKQEGSLIFTIRALVQKCPALRTCIQLQARRAAAVSHKAENALRQVQIHTLTLILGNPTPKLNQLYSVLKSWFKTVVGTKVMA